jgi:hypothetical protein
MKFSSIGFIGSQGLDVDYLIVGGGQAGESSNQTDYAGYGGAGGGYTVNQTSIALGASYPIVVGLGGVAGGIFGETSSFGDITSVYPAPTLPESVTCGTTNPATYKQGGSGSASTGSLPFCTGTGTDRSGKGGDGGSGSIWYDGNYYAGGGGSATFTSEEFAGVGGIGGGGRGGYNTAEPVTGSKNTGGGGGGSSQFGSAAGAAGGSGIVKIRYYGSGSKATGGTITYSDGYTYHSFTASATLTTL